MPQYEHCLKAQLSLGHYIYELNVVYKFCSVLSKEDLSDPFRPRQHSFQSRPQWTLYLTSSPATLWLRVNTAIRATVFLKDPSNDDSLINPRKLVTTLYDI